MRLAGRRALLGGLLGAGATLPLAAALLDGRRRAEAQPGVLPAAELRELELRRAESQLLHRKVELGGLRLLRDGRLLPEPSHPVARLLIVHIWAIECRPCVEEFPILRRITDSLRDLPQVKAVLVSETLDQGSLVRFFAEHRQDLPRVDHYQSIDDRLRASLQNRSQPTTLLLDALGVVRQALLGSLKLRRSELADAIGRLARTV